MTTDQIPKQDPSENGSPLFWLFWLLIGLPGLLLASFAARLLIGVAWTYL